MSLPKIERNKEIVKRKEQGWSFSRIGEFFNLDKKTVWEIYTRDREKYAYSSR